MQNGGMPIVVTTQILQFLEERHLATLTTLRADGSPHVVPVGFTFDQDKGLARVICRGGSVKARNAMRGGRAAVCQVDGRRWLSMEGPVRVATDSAAVDEAVRRYAERYRQPEPRADRVAIEITVDRLLGRG